MATLLRTTGGFSRPYTPVQLTGLAVGTAFLLLAVAGVVPAVAPLPGLPVPAGAGALRPGTVPVPVAATAVHLCLGLAGLLTARSAHAARGYLALGAALAGLLAAASDPGPGAVLHAALALVMLVGAMLVRGRPLVRPGRRGRPAV